MRAAAAALLALVVAVAVAAAAIALGGDGDDPPARAQLGSIWLTPEEIATLPTEGEAWEAVVEAADDRLGDADVSDQESDHDVRTLANALVYARTGEKRHRRRVERAIEDAIGTERGGRTLALARNLVSYVIAAQIVALADSDAELAARFREWLADVRDRRLADGRTLIETHEERPNNWGTMAGASRAAVAVYLGDRADLDRAARVFRGYLGDRDAWVEFRYGDDLSWQADPDAPVGVNPEGEEREGLAIGGALPDDMRRGCAFRLPPCPTGYAWEALQGALVQAAILARNGHDAWQWSDRALLRAVEFLRELDDRYGGWEPGGDDEWQPWLVNYAYGTDFPARSPARPGKNVGFTDWTHASRD